MTRARVAQRLRNDLAPCVAVVVCVLGAVAAAAPRPAMIRQQPSAKAARTAAQAKIDSRLLREIDRKRTGTAPPADAGIKLDSKGRALVDVRVPVTPAIRKKIAGLGGTVTSASVEYHSILAWMPLLKLDRLAADPSVRAIVPPSGATTRE